ncbi:MAG: TIGR01777 family oxidoreductase [Bacteroidetes bacterium]|nr:TIGR01777 family oxidoreductase [Bacteroidota bacterium]
MAVVLITGGKGSVGKHLSDKLKEKGFTVAIVSRKSFKDNEIRAYAWDIDNNEIEKEAIETADYIIHLAGANIGDKRWTAKRRKLILDSRVKSGQLLFNKTKENKNNLKAFISASAIGYYGTITTDKIFSEEDLPANDFLGETCRQWEQAADNFEKLGIRTVKIRTGIVLTAEGGALAKMIAPVKLGIGSAIGSGRQFMPWIHIDDLCAIYIKAIEDIHMNGAYNAVSTNCITNIEFTKTLARVLKKPFWFPKVPAFLLKFIYGKMSEMILKGSSVSSEKIIKAGCQFEFSNLEVALVDLLIIKSK